MRNNNESFIFSWPSTFIYFIGAGFFTYIYQGYSLTVPFSGVPLFMVTGGILFIIFSVMNKQCCWQLLFITVFTTILLILVDNWSLLQTTVAPNFYVWEGSVLFVFFITCVTSALSNNTNNRSLKIYLICSLLTAAALALLGILNENFMLIFRLLLVVTIVMGDLRVSKSPHKVVVLTTRSLTWSKWVLSSFTVFVIFCLWSIAEYQNLPISKYLQKYHLIEFVIKFNSNPCTNFPAFTNLVDVTIFKLNTFLNYYWPVAEVEPALSPSSAKIRSVTTTVQGVEEGVVNTPTQQAMVRGGGGVTRPATTTILTAPAPTVINPPVTIRLTAAPGGWQPMSVFQRAWSANISYWRQYTPYFRTLSADLIHRHQLYQYQAARAALVGANNTNSILLSHTVSERYYQIRTRHFALFPKPASVPPTVDTTPLKAQNQSSSAGSNSAENYRKITAIVKNIFTERQAIIDSFAVPCDEYILGFLNFKHHPNWPLGGIVDKHYFVAVPDKSREGHSLLLFFTKGRLTEEVIIYSSETEPLIFKPETATVETISTGRKTFGVEGYSQNVSLKFVSVPTDELKRYKVKNPQKELALRSWLCDDIVSIQTTVETMVKEGSSPLLNPETGDVLTRSISFEPIHDNNNSKDSVTPDTQLNSNAGKEKNTEQDRDK